MGKRIALTALLVLILGGALLQQLYINNTTDNLTDGLLRIKTALKSGEEADAIEAANAFYLLWDKERKMYQTLFEHNEVDIISATTNSIQSYCASGDTAHALADIAATMYYIEHIKEMDRLRWCNIF